MKTVKPNLTSAAQQATALSLMLKTIVSRTTLAHAVSGSLASCVAMSLTYP
jgi:hypothetical protein